MEYPKTFLISPFMAAINAIHPRYLSIIYRHLHPRFSSTSCRRKHIRTVNPASVLWFPGHMRKGMNQIDQKIAMVDVVIEVHDARIPFSGRSNFIQQFDQIRPHILILNKMDLAEEITDMSEFRSSLIEKSRSLGHNLTNVYFTQLNHPEKQRRLLHRILNELPELCEKLPSAHTSLDEFSDCYDQPTANAPSTLLTLAVGIPNSGKSTLINALRTVGRGGSGGAARVGRSAGQTRSVGHPIIISRSAKPSAHRGHGFGENLSIQMLDSPGILEARSMCLTEQLSLGVCGALDWDIVDREVLVDYLLFWWNSRGRTEYVSVFDLPGPTDNVLELLVRVCAQNDFYQTISARGSRWQAPDIEVVAETLSKLTPDFPRATRHVLRLFEQGAFGRTTFLPSDEQEAAHYFVLASK